MPPALDQFSSPSRSHARGSVWELIDKSHKCLWRLSVWDTTPRLDLFHGVRLEMKPKDPFSLHEKSWPRSWAGFWDITHGRDVPAWEQWSEWSVWGPGIASGPQRAADWWGDTGPPPVNVSVEAKCFFRKVIFTLLAGRRGVCPVTENVDGSMSEINLCRWNTGQLESAWVSLTLRVSTSKRPEAARDKHSDGQEGLLEKFLRDDFEHDVNNPQFEPNPAM